MRPCGACKPMPCGARGGGGGEAHANKCAHRTAQPEGLRGTFLASKGTHTLGETLRKIAGNHGGIAGKLRDGACNPPTTLRHIRQISWAPNAQPLAVLSPPGLPVSPSPCKQPTFFQRVQKCSAKETTSVSDGDVGLRVAAKGKQSVAHQQMTVANTDCSMTLWGLLAPRAHRVTCWNKLWGNSHSWVPWLLDAHALATLGGRDDGGRHPITI